ncbi:MAG: hypothetical protein N3F03_06185 [Ignavibacteria bacterium]|nr:hypothetical protein [Ignavibacteria bacterium]
MKLKIVFALILFSSLQIFSQPKTSQISSQPGAFARMGFAARGMAMGNAMTSVTIGSVNSYYNPALNPFINDNSIQLGYTFLSLDRKLNFVQISKSFVQYKRDQEGNKTDQIYSKAGVTFGIINSGVDNIDGRDNSGIQTKIYSTSENLFFLSVGINPSENLSFGATAKYYHYSLFDKMSSTGVGFDIGLIYKIFDNLTVGGFIGDINSKYRWDSTPLYSEKGNNFYDYFPLLKRIGLSYFLPKNFGIVAIDFETTSYGTKILKAGTEINLVEFLKLRAGVDRFNLENSDMIPQLTFGFGISQILYNRFFELNYAFVTEPYAPFDKHVITIGVRL